MKTPCKDCDIRREGCHVFCIEYREFRKERDAENAERLKKRVLKEHFADNAIKAERRARSVKKK